MTACIRVFGFHRRACWFPVNRYVYTIPQQPCRKNTGPVAASIGSNIDHALPAHYIGNMNRKAENPAIEQELAALEQQVETLLGIIDRLMKENRSLRVQQENLATERAGLLEKHDQVRHRVDAIVTRLKSLETGT
jgi:cell division protein ZapB